MQQRQSNTKQLTSQFQRAACPSMIPEWFDNDPRLARDRPRLATVASQTLPIHLLQRSLYCKACDFVRPLSFKSNYVADFLPEMQLEGLKTRLSFLRDFVQEYEVVKNTTFLPAFKSQMVVLSWKCFVRWWFWLVRWWFRCGTELKGNSEMVGRSWVVAAVTW